ncbi:MAG TPA: hypothetical protein VK211_18880 [Kamptonema sp.]|nr:hypothetical protein [Kamptonema sp.]
MEAKNFRGKSCDIANFGVFVKGLGKLVVLTKRSQKTNISLHLFTLLEIVP